MICELLLLTFHFSLIPKRLVFYLFENCNKGTHVISTKFEASLSDASFHFASLQSLKIKPELQINASVSGCLRAAASSESARAAG